MKVTLTIPENLDEITLKQYKQFLTVSEDISGEFYNQRLIETLCNVPFARVRMIKKKDVNEIVSSIIEMLNGEKSFRYRFFIKDMEFGMIPDLEDMTSGEYADLTEYIGDWQTMNKAMAVLFRPIVKKSGDKYSITEYNGTAETSELMDFMPLGIAMGAMFFFYNLTNDLINATQHSLTQEIVEEILQSPLSLERNGDGTSTSTHSLKEALENLITLQN